jgi:hypothetical protein
MKINGEVVELKAHHLQKDHHQLQKEHQLQSHGEIVELMLLREMKVVGVEKHQRKTTINGGHPDLIKKMKVVGVEHHQRKIVIIVVEIMEHQLIQEVIVDGS